MGNVFFYARGLISCVSAIFCCFLLLLCFCFFLGGVFVLFVFFVFFLRVSAKKHLFFSALGSIGWDEQNREFPLCLGAHKLALCPRRIVRDNPGGKRPLVGWRHVTPQVRGTCGGILFRS